MRAEENEPLKGMGILYSYSVFVSAAIALIFATDIAIPYLSDRTGLEPILFWFLAGGLGIFLPLVILAYFILKSEGYGIDTHTWTERMRFRKMTRGDWFWSVGALVVISISSIIIMKSLEYTVVSFNHSPDFMTFEPLSKGRYWLLAVWLPYWVLNILGEEIIWRGVLLPRQEVACGASTWMLHSTGWMIFHLAFGWQLVVTLLPILFILPYVVQKRKNSWIGVIIHGGLNGPMFLAIAFGLM